MSDLTTIALAQLAESPTNPRQTYDQAQLAELAESIRSVGLLQPIVVRRVPGRSKYEIVCGHRRVRAAELAGLAEVPALVKALDDREAAFAALAENSQRADVSPLEESAAFARLTAAGVESEEIAARLGRPKRFVSDRLSLQRLVPEFSTALTQGQLPLGGALLLATLPTDTQAFLAGKSLKPAAAAKPWTVDVVRSSVLGASSQLSRAPFDLADDTYAPRSCSTCSHRSDAQTELFGGPSAVPSTSAACLVPKCFDAKREQLFARKRAEGYALLSNNEVGPNTRWAGVEWSNRDLGATWGELAARCTPPPPRGLVYDSWSPKPLEYVDRDAVLATLTKAGDPAAVRASEAMSPEAKAKHAATVAAEAERERQARDAFVTHLAFAIQPTIAVAETRELQVLAHVLLDSVSGGYPGAKDVEERWRCAQDKLGDLIDAEYVTVDALRRLSADLLVAMCLQAKYRAASTFQRLRALAGLDGLLGSVADSDGGAEDDLDEETNYDDDSDGCLEPEGGAA